MCVEIYRVFEVVPFILLDGQECRKELTVGVFSTKAKAEEAIKELWEKRAKTFNAENFFTTATGSRVSQEDGVFRYAVFVELLFLDQKNF